MTKTYGICRIYAERNGSVLCGLNIRDWGFPANLSHLEGVDPQLFGAFYSNITTILQNFGFPESSAMIRVEDQHKNEYGVLHTIPRNLNFECCEQHNRCPYLTGLLIETASYNYDNLIKRFFKRVSGREERIHNVRPAEQLHVDLFYSKDPFNYGEQIFEIIHRELNNFEKMDFCDNRARDFSFDLTDLCGNENETGVVFRKYAPVAAFIFPFCEYLAPQRNPGVVSFANEPNSMPDVGLFGEWISAVQNYFNSAFGIYFRNLTYQAPDHCICLRSSRRNTLFGVIGAPSGEDGIPILKIERRIENFADTEGASDELCAIFDEIGLQYETPAVRAGAIVREMDVELRNTLNRFWQRIHVA